MSEYLKNHEMMTAVQQCGTVNEQKNSGLIPREWLAVSRLRNGPLTAVHNNGRPEHFGDARQPSAMQKNSVARSLATREKKKQTNVSSKNTATSTDAAHVTSTADPRSIKHYPVTPQGGASFVCFLLRLSSGKISRIKSYQNGHQLL